MTDAIAVLERVLETRVVVLNATTQQPTVFCVRMRLQLRSHARSVRILFVWVCTGVAHVRSFV